MDLRTCVGTACVPVVWTNVSITAGDGTVPLLSSTRRANGKDLNGPEAVLCRAPGAEQEHGAMPGSPDVLTLVLDLLADRTSGCTTLQTAAASSANAYYLTVAGAALPIVADSQGNTGGGDPTTPTPYAGLRDISFQQLDLSTYLLVLPQDQVYTVTLPVTATATLLQVEEGSGEGINRRVVYRDLNSPLVRAAPSVVPPASAR